MENVDTTGISFKQGYMLSAPSSVWRNENLIGWVTPEHDPVMGPPDQKRAWDAMILINPQEIDLRDVTKKWHEGVDYVKGYGKTKMAAVKDALHKV